MRTMAEAFAFNARQFFDFSQEHDDQNVDEFFDLAEETPASAVSQYQELFDQIVESEGCRVSDTENDCFFSPLETDQPSVGGPGVYLEGRMRRSLSMNNLPTDKDAAKQTDDLSQALSEVHLEPDNLPRRPTSSCSSHSHVSKGPSKEHINRLAQPKRFKSHDNLSKMNPMTLAEAVVKFQAGTPKRFRSRPSPKMNKIVPFAWGGTKAHTPKLLTTKRSRPVVALSKEEQEMKEAEEMRKFKIKANPINHKVMRGPLKPPVEKKPPTVAEPFHLTEVKKKTESEEKKVPLFKAQPIPKSLSNPFKPQVTGQSATKPQSPKFSKRHTRSTPDKCSNRKSEAPKPFKPSRTLPMPFSFEKRDQQLMKKREDMINRMKEEEMKIPPFHARPPPKGILKTRNNSQETISEAGSSKSFKSVDEMDTTFRARPATVLHMKPFEPKKDENHLVKIEAFQLSTEQRLEARKKFEEKIKEKEALAEAHKKQMEEIKKIFEEEEVAKIRKQMEHKAQPIKKYKEIKIEPSRKVTEPKSPKLHTNRIRNKENIQ